MPCAAPAGQALRPVVEVEEAVYSYKPAENGAGPMWCSGSTCLVRVDQQLFASGLETIPDCSPLNNCRWTLFQRQAQGWQLVRADALGRTREPAPMATFADGRFFLSANPTLVPNGASGGGPARPEIAELAGACPEGPIRTWIPMWEGTPRFSEHSYRTFVADGPARELLLFQNIDYAHAEFCFLDRNGEWAARGRLLWPWGADYEKPQPIRICYPTAALKNRAVYFCGVSDIVEPNQKWREFKRQLTKREWDYDFRRLFFTWSPDIRTGQFQPWLELASREKTAGWIFPGDLWPAPDGRVHIVWTERALDERLRDTFFPDTEQSHAINYAVLRDGQVLLRRTLLESRPGGSQEIPSAPRFQVTPDHRLFLFYYVQGTNPAGTHVSENRVLEIAPDATLSSPVRIDLKQPFTAAFTATPRAGSPPSETLELLGPQAGKPNTISYARIRLN